MCVERFQFKKASVNFSNAGGSQPTPAQQHVHSDLTSGSDFDFLHLVQSSNSEADASGTESRSYEKFANENQIPDDKITDSTQQIVNQTIMSHLEKISSRLNTLERNSCTKLVDASEIKNKKLKKSQQNVHLASTSGPVSSLPLSHTVPEVSGCVHKTKAKVTHAQTQPVVQVGSDSTVPTLQSLKYDQQIQEQVDQRFRELADIAHIGTCSKVK